MMFRFIYFFLFMFFWFIFKIFFINLFFISALYEKNKQHFETLRMPTKTSDTFKNILLEFLNFQEHFFREMGASFRKFSHLFFRFVFFVFVFLVYFKIFLLIYFITTSRNLAHTNYDFWHFQER